MKRKQRRLAFVVAGMVALGAAVALVLSAFEESLVFFYTPSDLAAKNVPEGRRMRIGGLVEDGSLERSGDGLTITFRITDLSAALPVTYKGLLPDLFREGQGVVAEGFTAADGVFRADAILAKHDENYMPPEVAEALKKSGVWQGAAQGEAAQ